MRAAHVDRQRRRRRVPRLTDVRRAGAVIHARAAASTRIASRTAARSSRSTACQRTPAMSSGGAPPGRARRPVGACGREQIEQVASGETGGAGDSVGRDIESERQRGTPLRPPLNGEKLPRPASVNERKKRWSDGTPTTVSPCKLYALVFERNAAALRVVERRIRCWSSANAGRRS